MPDADDGAPKANVLAFSKGYVELQGAVLRVIPHVQNLETCARHCDTEAACTHWRRCAGALLTFCPPMTACVAQLKTCQSALAAQCAARVADLATPCCKAHHFKRPALEDGRQRDLHY